MAPQWRLHACGAAGAACLGQENEGSEARGADGDEPGLQCAHHAPKALWSFCAPGSTRRHKDSKALTRLRVDGMGRAVFMGATSFNQDVSGFDTSSVTDMTGSAHTTLLKLYGHSARLAHSIACGCNGARSIPELCDEL